MANTLVIKLNDVDYNSIKLAAERDGTQIEAWLVHAAKVALANAPAELVEACADDADAWPPNFFDGYDLEAWPKHPSRTATGWLRRKYVS